MSRGITIRSRLTLDEWRLVTTAAKADQRTLSDFARLAMLDRARAYRLGLALGGRTPLDRPFLETTEEAPG